MPSFVRSIGTVYSYTDDDFISLANNLASTIVDISYMAVHKTKFERNFVDCRLQHAVFKNCEFVDCEFVDSNLQNTIFLDCKFIRTNILDSEEITTKLINCKFEN